MAHFAKIENGVVTDLVVIANDDCGGGDFPESEPIGQAFIASLAQNDPRLEGSWVQTSYNTHNGLYFPTGMIEYERDEDGNLTPINGTPEGAFRKNFGQIGWRYVNDEFLPPVE